MFRRKNFLLVLWAFLAVLALPATELHAFHFPWDQGHDTFSPNPGDNDTDPGDGSPCKSWSPVELLSGNFSYATHDFVIAGSGPALSLARIYNSRDMRNGVFGHGWSHSFDQRLVETTDGVSVYVLCHQPNGKRERFLRNADGTFSGPMHLRTTLTKRADGTYVLTDKGGRRRIFDAEGRFTSVVDRNGNSLTFSYDATGFPTTIADGTGRSLTLTKGPDGRVANVTDPAGRSFRYRYDASGNLVAVTDPLGNTSDYVYDAKHNLLRVLDRRGNVNQQITYDSQGRVTTYLDQGNTWTLTYTPAQKRTTKRDSGGRIWTYLYNDAGNLIQVTDPTGKSESFTYDANLNLTGYTNKNGKVTTFTYDARGNITSIRNALGEALSYTFETTFDRPATFTDALGRPTQFTYDTRGNLVRILDPLGNERTFTYDSAGHLLTSRDPNGTTTRFSYDAYGNVTEVTNPLGHRSTSSYDIVGNITAVTDANGQTDQFFYDGLNQLIEVRRADGSSVLYQHDAAGNLARLTDPKGKVTTFTYDSFNRLTKAEDPAGRVLTYAFDTRGNLASATDPAGRVASFAYDTLDRLIRKTTPDDIVTYSYDSVGNLLSVADGDSRLDYVFDALNRITEVRTSGSAMPVTTLRYSYDANGNRSALSDSFGGTTQYAYDAVNRLTRITNFQGEETSFQYDAGSRRTRRTSANGVASSFSYDTANRPVSLAHELSGAPISRFDYGYEPTGNRSSVTTLNGSSTYRYDNLYQLVEALHTDPQLPDESYSYDSAGNRMSSHLSPEHRYDALQRLLEDSRFNYEYDNNGNLARKIDKSTSGATRFTYDSDNLLTRVDFADGTFATYRYDGFGRRIEKNVAGAITRFVYDGPDVYVEFDGAGARTARYTHGPATDEPISVERNGQTFYFLTDALGSVTEIVDGNGQIVQSYKYDSFGRILERTHTFPDTYAFAGHRIDPETGLYAMRARMYDPFVGRFLQEDPIRFAGGLNLYRYVGNNPVNLTDPTGLFPCLDQWLDGLQLALDLGGLIPGFGEPLDLINAGIYGLRGDYLNAGLSAAGAIPFAGWGATAGKLGNKAAQAGIKEGIYEFTAKSGQKYVGQSSDIDRRLAEHIRSGKVTPEEAARATRTEVTGGKTAREVAEQRRINELDGIDNLDNIRNPIGPNRQHLLDND